MKDSKISVKLRFSEALVSYFIGVSYGWWIRVIIVAVCPIFKLMNNTVRSLLINPGNPSAMWCVVTNILLPVLLCVLTYDTILLRDHSHLLLQAQQETRLL